MTDDELIELLNNIERLCTGTIMRLCKCGFNRASKKINELEANGHIVKIKNGGGLYVATNCRFVPTVKKTLSSPYIRVWVEAYSVLGCENRSLVKAIREIISHNAEHKKILIVANDKVEMLRLKCNLLLVDGRVEIVTLPFSKNRETRVVIYANRNLSHKSVRKIISSPHVFFNRTVSKAFFLHKQSRVDLWK